MPKEAAVIATALAGVVPKVPMLANGTSYSLDTRAPGAHPAATPLTAEQMHSLEELYSSPPAQSALQAQLAQLKNSP